VLGKNGFGELDELDELATESLLFPHPQAFWVRHVVGEGARASNFARWQVALKRTLDVVLATLLLLISLPLIVMAAIAIKVQDGGPVFFRQTRVGRHGRKFTILKLRTMVPDADRHLPLLAAANGRTGPLFKMLVDPRVTPVGRLLRSSSIDELPQLLNVLAGSMSLVGPRPALPAEVAQFGEPLMVRLQVKPGITGLWQVEARDDPAFERYQKLDLYYLLNWSIRLDLAILLSTVRPVVHRLYRSTRGEAAELMVATADRAATASGPD
jgi:lipopolysaccharide/colanic/teichoic acid biosynthesis glycosyltransferase